MDCHLLELQNKSLNVFNILNDCGGHGSRTTSKFSSSVSSQYISNAKGNAKCEDNFLVLHPIIKGLYFVY